MKLKIVLILFFILSLSACSDESYIDIVPIEPVLGEAFYSNQVLTYNGSILDIENLYFCGDEEGNKIEFFHYSYEDFRPVDDWGKNNGIFDILTEYRLYCDQEFISLVGVRSEYDSIIITAIHEVVESYGKQEKVDELKKLINEKVFSIDYIEQALISYTFFSYSVPYSSNSTRLESQYRSKIIKDFSTFFQDTDFKNLHKLNILIFELNSYEDKYGKSQITKLYQSYDNVSFYISYEFYPGEEHFRTIKQHFLFNIEGSLEIEYLEFFKSDQCFPSPENCRRYEQSHYNKYIPSEFDDINFDYLELYYSDFVLEPVKIFLDYFKEPFNKIALNRGESIINSSLGGFHSSLITSEARIFMWGSNDYGQLGDGTLINRYTPKDITSEFNLNSGETIIYSSLGGLHSSLLTSEGRIFMWGRNELGQIGDGTITNRSIPKDITSQFNLNAGENITSISLGANHSSAMTSEGRIFMWGRNEYGQIGDGTITNRSIPKDITSQFNLNAGENITSISLGASHSSAITSEGRIFMWGSSDYGQIGDGTITNRSIPKDITSQFNFNSGEIITYSSLGGLHSSLITSEGRVFMWGSSDYGQLGDGTLINRYTPKDITSEFNLNFGENISSISLGFEHSSAMTSEGRIFMWGNNIDGQLGYGTNWLTVRIFGSNSS
jgi:alpha-tubulin suppressor-like RCC1 family protein